MWLFFIFMPRKKEENGVIYKITSPKGSVYIGQTVNYADRICAYKRADCEQQGRLYNSIVAHGWSNHSIEIIEILPRDLELLNEREIYWIEYYKSNIRRYRYRKGLNLNDGGGVIEARSGREQYQYKGDVYQIDLKTGNLVGQYPNGNQAGLANNISPIKINKVLRGEAKQYYGYFFTRDFENWELEYKKALEASAKRYEIYHDRLRHKVSAFSPDGNLYKTFKSLTDASKHFDFNDGRSIKINIDYNLKNKKRRLLWGHVWKYYEDK